MIRASLIVAVLYVVGVVIAWWLVDCAGRWPLPCQTLVELIERAGIVVRFLLSLRLW